MVKNRGKWILRYTNSVWTTNIGLNLSAPTLDSSRGNSSCVRSLRICISSEDGCLPLFHEKKLSNCVHTKLIPSRHV